MSRKNPVASLRAQLRTQVLELESRIVPALTAAPIIAIGSGPGMDSTVKVLDVNGNLLSEFKPYPLPDGTYFGGGIDTAVGDINGDSVPDVITAAGFGGGPHVKVFNGVDIQAGSSTPGELRSFFAFEPTFPGGVNVAAGDVNGDGLVDIICGAGPGGTPHVVVYSNGVEANQLMNFWPYELTFRGGVRVAAGDFGGDGITEEVVTGAGPGGGPKVLIFNFLPQATSATLAQQKLAEFFAFDSNLRDGVYVAAGTTTNNRDSQGNLYADVIAGSGDGMPAEVRTFRLLDANRDELTNPAWQYQLAGSVVPYAGFTGGVHVGIVRNGTRDDFTTGAGQGGGPHFKIYNQTSINDLDTYVPTQRFESFVFDASFLGGIWVS